MADREWQHVQRKLTSMKTGQTEYFHSTKGEPILITKGGQKRQETYGDLALRQASGPRVAKSIVSPEYKSMKIVGKPSTTKSFINPALGKYAKR